jgi:hypothetical protein
MLSENGRHYGEVVETTDEEGKIHYFEKVEEVEVDGKSYALLIYQGSEDDEEEEGGEGHVHTDACKHGSGEGDDEEGYEEEIVLMRISREDDGDVYETIEDDEEFEKVMQHIEALDDGAEEEEESEE